MSKYKWERLSTFGYTKWDCPKLTAYVVKCSLDAFFFKAQYRTALLIDHWGIEIICCTYIKNTLGKPLTALLNAQRIISILQFPFEIQQQPQAAEYLHSIFGHLRLTLEISLIEIQVTPLHSVIIFFSILMLHYSHSFLLNAKIGMLMRMLYFPIFCFSFLFHFREAYLAAQHHFRQYLEQGGWFVVYI